VQVALGRLELRRGDKLLLCSDGLSGKLKSEEMLAAVQQSASLEDACQKLIDMANGRGGDDNITVVLAQIDGEGLDVPRDQETLTQTFQVLAEYKAAAAGLGLDNDDDEEDDDPDYGLGEKVTVPIDEKPAPKRAAAPPPPAPDGELATRIATVVLFGLALVVLIFAILKR
jgi:hypothetical protein